MAQKVQRHTVHVKGYEFQVSAIYCKSYPETTLTPGEPEGYEIVSVFTDEDVIQILREFKDTEELEYLITKELFKE